MEHKMSNFTSSNGIELNKYGNATSTPPGGGREEVLEARKEFFQHLRDKELGRWRDPEAPNFVVYPSTSGNPNRIRVVDETTSHSGAYSRDKTDYTDYGNTAERYFEAHPVNPWSLPEKGEMWVLTHNGVTSAYLYGEGSLFRNDHMPALLPTDSNITDGYRIWPAEAE